MISIYDTLARKVSQIESSGSQVTVYCCGPTVYRDAHVGNLRTFLLADIIHRALIQQGAQVNFIQNITDVGHMSEDVQGEDKMLQQAHRKSVIPLKLLAPTKLDSITIYKD